MQELKILCKTNPHASTNTTAREYEIANREIMSREMEGKMTRKWYRTVKEAEQQKAPLTQHDKQNEMVTHGQMRNR